MTCYAPRVKSLLTFALVALLSVLVGPCTDPQDPVPVSVDAPSLSR